MTSQRQQLGLAVIGAGYWGPNLVRTAQLTDVFRLDYLCDLDVARAHQVLGEYSTVRATASLDEVLADPDVSAVAVATPAATHLPVARAALEAGKHVLVEKPLAATLDDGRDLVALAERDELVLMLDHTYCYTPAVAHLRELVRGGGIGTVQYVDSVRINLGIVQSDVDVLWDLAPHDLSIFLSVLPDDVVPVAVAAHGSDPIGAGRACVAHLTVQLSNGAIAHVHVNWLSPTKIRTMVIGGSTHTVVWDDLNPEPASVHLRQGRRQGRHGRRPDPRHGVVPDRRHGRPGAARAGGAARRDGRVRRVDHRAAHPAHRRPLRRARARAAGGRVGQPQRGRRVHARPRFRRPRRPAGRRAERIRCVNSTAAQRIDGQRVLVTGGAGTIGSAIVDLLVDAGAADVIVLDNFVRGRRANLAGAAERGGDRLTVVEGDINDRALVGELIQGVDIVFHLAALRITQCAQEPRLALETLVDGTFTVLEAAVAAGVAKVIASSSASVYGLAEEFPTTERHHPYNNDTFYGAAKEFNEGMLRSFHAMYGLDYVVLRYFNVYGPRMDIHGRYTEVFIRWMERIAEGEPPVIFGDGSETMDFVHVHDIAGPMCWRPASDATNSVYNIACATETSLRGLADELLAAMGSDLVPEHGPARTPVAA